MDIASLIGSLIGAAALTIVLFEVSHGNFMMFFSMEGVLTVGFGSVSVVLMAMPMDKALAVPGYIRAFLFSKSKNPVEVVKLLGELAEKARRDGILSIQNDMPRVEQFNGFLANGLRMAIDGTDPGNIETMLRLEIMSMQERHKSGKKFFDLVKLYGPGWALVGTLIGQIGMFASLEGAEIGKLGSMLAIAVCATMYGTVVANAIAGPIGDKLAIRSAEEIFIREMMLQGVMSIQAGDSPRITIDKMTAFIPPRGRTLLQKAA